jgi:hypothetical protein
VISSKEISADSYQSAFKLLKDRFDNKNIIIQNHITELFNLPPVSREDSILIRNLFDTFNKHFRALETLQQPFQHWEIFLIYFFCVKLDAITRRDWEKESQSDKQPTLKELLDIIQKKFNYKINNIHT